MDLGAMVKQRRKALGVTQEELARRASLSLGVVHRLEAGRIRDPHYSTLEALAGALGVDVGELLRDTVPLGPAPSEPGQPETAPAPAEPTIVPQSPAALRADIERIKRLKKQHESDLEKIREGELDYDAVLRMEAVDEGVRAGLEKRGVLGFAEAVRARRELADDESVPLALLRELRYLEGLTDEARALSARVTSDIHEEVEKGASQAESWVSERHERSS